MCISARDSYRKTWGKKLRNYSRLIVVAAVLAACAEKGSEPEWIIRPDGVGDVKIGMTIAELGPRLATPSDTATTGEMCKYVRLRDEPDSVMFMVEAGRVVRVDVVGGSTATAEGAQVGDSEGRILKLYPNARRQPHKYTDGRYLIVLPNAPADTLHRYVFETDGQRVTRFRAGVFPPVEYVEGCG